MTHRKCAILHKSLPEAMEACLTYARRKLNRSVDRVADLMGLPSKWRIYKWVEGADLPLRYLRPFEHACGVDHVTRYLAHSAHRLLIDIPTGRDIAAADVQTLQAHANDAVGALLAWAAGAVTADETIAAITRVMEGLAWHRVNVEKHAEPELDLEGEGRP